MVEIHKKKKKGETFSLSPPINIKPQNALSPLQTQGEHYAEEEPGQVLRHGRSVARRLGRPRKPRKRGGVLSMGRYPFMALLNKYLPQRRISWSETTYRERERKYRYLCEVFRELRSQGRTDTMNPEKFTEKEIYAFESWMQEKGLDPRTRAKYRGLIKDFLVWNENYVYEKLIRKGYIQTQIPPKEIQTISHEDFQELLNRASQKRERWHDHVAHLIIAMYGYLGLRNKELRLANIEDLDTTHWTFTVQHPKGEGRYGKKRTIPVVEPLRPVLREYLTIRAQYLVKRGFPEARPLIPSITTYRGRTTVSYYSGNRLRVLARKLAEDTGIPFQIKTLRASCGQFLKDMGADIEIVSKFLGHSSTETTERFYARVRDEAMFQEVNSLFSPKEGSAVSNLIGKNKYISGYA